MSASDRWGRRTVLAAGLLAVACGEGITPPRPTTGSLLVTISGLAAGTSAVITVTGPAGFTRSVTATETLSALAPGSYTIAAGNVSAGNYTHQPTPATQAVAVAASTTPATATVKYAPIDGALTVTITGLPAGANAAVNVTGPSGPARAVTTTTTLPALAPGGYTVNASAVTSLMTTYAPASAAQNLTVVAGATATATVAYQSTSWLVDLLIWGGSMEPPIFMTETFSDTACAVFEGLVQRGTRRLMRFGIEVRNAGTVDLFFGDPASNPLFTYAPCHGHYHFDDFALYRLVDSSGRTVGTGVKVGFCLTDYSRWDPSANPNRRYYAEECNPQGIQAGWSDVYVASLDGQWVDITSVPAGQYTLELTVDPENRIVEKDETNNVLRVQVTIPPGTGSIAALPSRPARPNTKVRQLNTPSARH